MVAGETFANVPSREASTSGVVVSAVLHLLLVLALIALARPFRFNAPVEETIDLQIVPAVPPETKPAAQPILPPASTPLPDVLPAPRQEAAPDATEQPAMHKATTMLSAGVLADPRSRQTREALPTLELGTRLEQICNLEAMAQVAKWDKSFKPDRVIAYAMANTKVKSGVITATGAAMRSGGNWYNLAFNCAISPETQQVQSFEFTVGKPIPREQWAGHALAPVY
nr:DUF930 domain-containing protein [Phyllobacterium myrsinacearum]